MTKYGKILTVFVTFVSVAFMGVSMVWRYGGPDWVAEKDKLTEYSFERAGPDSPWTVKSRAVSDEQIGSGKILPEAIVTAQKKKLADQQALLQKLDQEKQRDAARLKQARELVEVDQLALQKREEVLEQARRDLTNKIVETQAQAVVKTKDAQEKYSLGKLRREESILMRNQLEELRAQREAAMREKENLQDELIQAQGLLDRARLRNDLLQSDVAKDAAAYEKDAPTK
jgi:hypothetical protein